MPQDGAENNQTMLTRREPFRFANREKRKKRLEEIAHFVRNGNHPRYAAEFFSVSVSTVRKACKIHKVPSLPAKSKQAAYYVAEMSHAERRERRAKIANAIASGMSTADTALSFGATPTMISVACREECVHPRRVPPDEDAQLRTILDANRAHVQRMLDEAKGITMVDGDCDGMS